MVNISFSQLGLTTKLLILQLSFCILLAIILYSKASYQQDPLPLKASTLVIELQHKIGSKQEEFKPRGTILVKPKTEYRAAQATIDQIELTDPDIENFKESGGLYHLRAILRKKLANGEKSEPLQSSTTITKACSLVASNFADSVIVNLNPVNDFISVNLQTADPECLNDFNPRSLARKFDTSVQVDSGVLGPTPDTATYIKRLEEERQNKLKEGKEDNRSFFAKYWIYIVPAVVILMMFSGPEQGAR